MLQKLYAQIEILNHNYSSVWELNCGDGILLSSEEEWDDSNNYDGDGCSSICTIETGFECNTTVNLNICNPYEATKYSISYHLTKAVMMATMLAQMDET